MLKYESSLLTICIITSCDFHCIYKYIIFDLHAVTPMFLAAARGRGRGDGRGGRGGGNVFQRRR